MDWTVPIRAKAIYVVRSVYLYLYLCIYIYTHMNLKCRSVDLCNIYTLVLALLAKEINRKHNFHARIFHS
jgi:hypothetical protein